DDAPGEQHVSVREGGGRCRWCPRRTLRALPGRVGEERGTATLMTATTLLVAASITVLLVTLVTYITFQQRLQAAPDAAALAAAMEARQAFLDNLGGGSNLKPDEVQQRGKNAAQAMVRAEGFGPEARVDVVYPAVYEVRVEVAAPFSTGQVSARA